MKVGSLHDSLIKVAPTSFHKMCLFVLLAYTLYLAGWFCIKLVFRWRSFMSAWILMDILQFIFIVLFIIDTVLELLGVGLSNSFGEYLRSEVNSDNIKKSCGLDDSVVSSRRVNDVRGVLLILSVLRSLKYFALFPGYRIPWITFQTLLKRISTVAVLIFISTSMWALAGMLFFGKHSHYFSTFSESMITLVLLIMGTQVKDIYADIENASHVAGVYFWCFQIFFCLLIQAFVLAIVTYSYQLVMSSMEKNRRTIVEEERWAWRQDNCFQGNKKADFRNKRKAKESIFSSITSSFSKSKLFAKENRKRVLKKLKYVLRSYSSWPRWVSGFVKKLFNAYGPFKKITTLPESAMLENLLKYMSRRVNREKVFISDDDMKLACSSPFESANTLQVKDSQIQQLLDACGLINQFSAEEADALELKWSKETVLSNSKHKRLPTAREILVETGRLTKRSTTNSNLSEVSRQQHTMKNLLKEIVEDQEASFNKISTKLEKMAMEQKNMLHCLNALEAKLNAKVY